MVGDSLHDIDGARRVGNARCAGASLGDPAPAETDVPVIRTMTDCRSF